MKAWVVTWESINRNLQQDNVVVVLNPRWRTNRIIEIVELLYVEHMFVYDEKIAYAKNKKFHPYPAHISSNSGAPTWIRCGYNPCLVARKVDNICVFEGQDGEREWAWDEPVVDSKKMADIQRLIRGDKS